METAELVREFKAHHADVKSALEKAGVKDSELDARMREIEQKMARSGSAGGSNIESNSLGQTVVKSGGFEAFRISGYRGTQRIGVKSITSASNSAGGMIAPDRQPGVAALPQRRMTVRQLLQPGRTESNTIQYLKQTTRTTAAAMVAEGAQKPESAYAYELVDAPVRTLAHWVPVTRQAFDDAPQIQATIDGELRYGLNDIEEMQLLHGAGTGENLHGIYVQATNYVAPVDPPGH